MTKLDTRAELRSLIDEWSLTRKGVASLLGVGVRTVDSWLKTDRDTNRRRMPEYQLEHLKLALRHERENVNESRAEQNADIHSE